MSILNRFMSRIPSSKYIFKNGKEGAFIGGILDTDIESEIEELNAEVAGKHPHIYIDPAQATVDSEKVDPIEEIKRKAIEEYIASVKVASDPANDRGETKQEPVIPSSTADVNAAAADSSSGASVPVPAAASAPSILQIPKQ
jgi:hypothetical protein